LHWAGSSPGSRDLRTPDLNAQTGYMGGHACTGQSVHVREVPPDACTLKQMHIASAQSRTRNVQRTVASAQQTNGRKLKSRSPDGMVIRAFSPRLSCEMPSSQPFTTCPDLTRNLKWRPVGFLVLGSIGPAGQSACASGVPAHAYHPARGVIGGWRCESAANDDAGRWRTRIIRVRTLHVHVVVTPVRQPEINDACTYRAQTWNRTFSVPRGLGSRHNGS
jgi:hypothetical protein